MAQVLYHATHSDIARGCLRRNDTINSHSVECVECSVSSGSWQVRLSMRVSF